MDPLDQLSIPTPQSGSHDASAQVRYGQNPEAGPTNTAHLPPVVRTQARRDVFWNNVVREILMALSSAAAASSGRLGTGPSAAESSVSPVDNLFDGRMGVITSLGQRIPIADIIPVFACSMDSCDGDRSRSQDVQCTIYRITTPTGESYTLPISQIIGVHSLSDSLVEQLESNAVEEESDQSERVPFGFGAYTSLAKSEEEPPIDEAQNPEEQNESSEK